MTKQHISASMLILTLSFAANTRALEIPYDYKVSFTPETAILGYFSATKIPVLTVKSGAVVKIDVGGGARWRDGDPNAWLKENGIDTTVEANVCLQETIKVLAETKNRLP